LRERHVDGSVEPAPGVEGALMSGCAADAPPQKSSGNDYAVLLRKPFEKAERVGKIRALLDAPR
jgi:hypothetical protein